MMAFDNLLEAVCNVATVFFAMVTNVFYILIKSANVNIWDFIKISNYYLISL
ncbi:hypothetical protein J2X31_000157 [Flavobacterium arsenatis]|uniref:Uncharacterized protein n=1 Tax=Flavobacterium arsenatis TaxID=1484332 RepID=A0ABU1TJJ8_9FLAO|nr:hypothetical protein [Flavobacterium arsenatis]